MSKKNIEPWHIRRKPGTGRIYQVVGIDRDTFELLSQEWHDLDAVMAFVRAANEMYNLGRTREGVAA